MPRHSTQLTANGLQLSCRTDHAWHHMLMSCIMMWYDEQHTHAATCRMHHPHTLHTQGLARRMAPTPAGLHALGSCSNTVSAMVQDILSVSAGAAALQCTGSPLGPRPSAVRWAQAVLSSRLLLLLLLPRCNT
jgi:hypothetical protein